MEFPYYCFKGRFRRLILIMPFFFDFYSFECTFVSLKVKKMNFLDFFLLEVFIRQFWPGNIQTPIGNASGIYFLRLDTDHGFSQTRKLLMIK